MPSREAIALFASPSARSSSTSISRGVSGSLESASSSSSARRDGVRIASASRSDARAAASVGNSPTTSSEPSRRARNLARSAIEPTRNTRMVTPASTALLTLGSLTDREHHVERRGAPLHAQAYSSADTLLDQQIEKIFR